MFCDNILLYVSPAPVPHDHQIPVAGARRRRADTAPRDARVQSLGDSLVERGACPATGMPTTTCDVDDNICHKNGDMFLIAKQSK